MPGVLQRSRLDSFTPEHTDGEDDDEDRVLNPAAIKVKSLKFRFQFGVGDLPISIFANFSVSIFEDMVMNKLPQSNWQASRNYFIHATGCRRPFSLMVSSPSVCSAAELSRQLLWRAPGVLNSSTRYDEFGFC